MKNWKHSKIRNRTRTSASLTFIQHCARGPGHCNKARKRNKGMKIGKNKIKLFLGKNDMILYIENLKESIK